MVIDVLKVFALGVNVEKTFVNGDVQELENGSEKLCSERESAVVEEGCCLLRHRS